jgi:hypothetical protein
MLYQALNILCLYPKLLETINDFRSCNSIIRPLIHDPFVHALIWILVDIPQVFSTLFHIFKIFNVISCSI